MELSDVKDLAERIRAEVGKAIVGQRDTVDLMLTALFSGGHILLEGPPGTGKTLLAQSLAASLALQYGRIQFTPDLMPGDVVGTNLFNFQTSTFSIVKGPIFCNLLLADEINRTPPKTQAALLEAMQERRVTVAGHTYQLPSPFFVLATQNPIEQEGTYPLPEAQMDRFMFNLRVDYPSRTEEVQILQETTRDDPQEVSKVLTGEQLLALQHCVRQVPVPPSVAEYAVDLVQSTRPKSPTSPDFIQRYVQWGAGPRASQ